jgi:hypothetical protein
MRIREKFAWGVAAALGLFVIAAMAGVATSGPLDPPGPVGSTMKTLEEIPGSWSRVLSTEGADPCNTERFRCVLDDEAVLDLETGLVWERDMDVDSGGNWFAAMDFCQNRETGGVFGWRLPTVDEFSTLMVPGLEGGLPPNHPFGPDFNVWTATESAVDETRAWIAITVFSESTTALKTSSGRVWCVRGPA